MTPMQAEDACAVVTTRVHVAWLCRGYAGDIAAPAALDVLANDGNVALIDVRTAKEKEGSGIPDLPSAANGKVCTRAFLIFAS